MADKTRDEMITQVLRRLGILGQGQTAPSNLSTIVGDVIDSVHPQYRKRGLAPFATSAFPDWSQEPFAKIFAREAAPYFGKRGDAAIISDGAMGDRELAEQMQGRRNALPTRIKDF